MLNFKEKLTKKGITNTQIGILFTTIIIAIAMVIVAVSLKITQVYNAKNVLTPENLKASTYTQITGEDAKVENCDYVLFSAFFTRDLNGDGNAEKLLGTCKEINEPDQLYIDLNVLSNGYLENGKITINGQNFKYAMNMVKDNVLKNTYISNNVKEIELNKIEAGTQKLIIGNVIANLENNINNYTAGISQNDLNNVSNELKKHQVNTITLTGTHVADDGTKTEISKTIPVIIDWYGKAETNLYTQNKTYYYDNMENNTISINIKINEIYKQLILKENILNLSIPDLKGFAPTEVKCINSNVESKYDEETKVLSIKRESQIDEDGKVISSLSNSNTYTVEITYPQEAYDSLQNYTTITVPITGYYTCYNNQNEEFENPYKTNIAKDQVKVLFRDVPQGEIYNFYAYYDNKQYITEPYYKYVISKQNLINLYNKQELDEQTPNEKFIVKWIAVRGQTGEVPSMIMSETKQESEKYGDKFSDIVMDEYIVNTGIYFENADNMLGETGEIKIYNNDTNELIKTFTVKEWNTYTKQNPYTYEIPIKHIRVETSKANVNNILTVYNVKELQTLKFIQNYKLEQLKQMNTVYTYLTGICNIEGQESGTRNVLDYAEFIEEKSIATISVSKNQLETQETTKNQQITITARYNNIGDSKWKNANYIVEIPKEIINMEINDVTISNDNVQLVGYEIYKENEQYFIKIITQNANQESYTININCNMTPDPRKPTSHKSLKLYASNEWNSEYYYQAQDIYDINGNNDTEEIVGTNNTGLDLLSPTSLITLETVSNYNNKQEITIAPNVADVEKQTREATISMELTNNYTTVVSGVQILGKIPYKGNTYILNGNSMNSQFTTVMKNTGIQVPLELQEKTVVYYSTKENPDKDITNPANAWTLLENVEDFSEIKSYLINMKEYVLEKGKQYNFSYNVNIPEGIEYNMVSYSNHAVFCELDTDGGKLTISTEPNKVGIRIARKLDLEVIKNKFGMEKVVPGARYKLTQTNENGEEIASKICTTDANGKMIFKDLYINAKYVFKEIRESSNYSLNTDVIEFETNENASGELVINVTSQDKFKTVPIVTKDANGKDIVKTTVENEPRYNVEITKIDIATGEKLENVQFKILETGSIYRTDLNGKVIIEKLQQNVTYTLKEIKADGYYLPEDIQFKLIKDAQGKLKIESQNSNFANANIENTEENDLIKVSLRISNEKIPTYNLQVLKVEENADEQELDKLKTLQGAIFKFKYEDLGIEKIVTTNKDGSIDISDLYQYVDGKYITGKYTLQELQSPEGYANNGEKINFRVIKDAENNLQIEIEDKDNLNTVKNTIIDGNTVKLIVQNKPLFKIRKTDSDTGTPIANVKFVIYECNENYNPVDFAKDVNGNYVGKKDEKDRYVITTDEKGEITIPLREAKYKIEEIEQPEKYSQNNYWKFFEIGENKNSGVDEDGNIEIYELEKKYQDIVDNAEKGDNELEVALEIDSIEDLVKFSNDVNSGNTYENKMVKLIKTLDFEDDSSYENPNRKAFGDLNANGVVEGLKEELTNKNGCGFTPIGSSDGNLVNTFKGVFDGQKNEIRNLYINSKKYNVGLFGNATYKIKNVGITGEIIGEDYVAGIVASWNETPSIINCYNKCDINGSEESITSGIAVEGKIINCYNTGNIHNDRGGAGGIGSGVIINCYNTGTISSKQEAGGIILYTNSGIVRNSYNLGDVISESYASGIGKNGDVKNCYNAGTITGEKAFGLGVNIRCESNFNAGTITGKEDAAGISYSSSEYCYNTGDVISINGDASGIGANAICCYNTGNITAAESAYGISSYTADICYNTGNVKGNDESAGISNSVRYCYNTGNVTSSKKASGLGFNNGNSYCLDTAKISAPEVISSPIVSDEYMKSMEFVDVLNSNDNKYYEAVWKHKNNQYPQLLINVGEEIKEITELNIKNTINKYKITTDVEEINGVKGGTITGEDENPFETVDYGKNNTKEIKMVPDENYAIVQIKINGIAQDFNVSDDGSYTIPAGFFTEMKENKHIVVKYMSKHTKLVINKVDKFDSNKKLKGAKFKIEQIEEKYKVENQISDSVITQGEYGFDKTGESKYVSNNKGKDNTVATSYIPIDLTGFGGEYTLTVNAMISSESYYDCGYAIISDNTTVPNYSQNKGRFIYIYGNVNQKNYTTVLTGGKMYYLHLIYKKNNSTSSGNDIFTINSISLKFNNPEIQTNDLGQAFAELSFGKYKITELEAPEGYIKSEEPIEYEMVEDKENEITIQNIKPENTKIDKEFTIHKKSNVNNTNISNVKFVIYKVDSNQKNIDFAKSANGEYIGVKDNQERYVVTTDENGEIKLMLPPGYYKAVEIETAPGYILEQNEENRSTYFSISDIEINYIEDLLDLSENVTNGESYENKVIGLTRTLDFNDDSSYRNPNDTTTYGDYNLDEKIEGIKAELINKNGIGFHPIGEDYNSNKVGEFRGTFDGNGYEIRNIYINGTYSGLFRKVTNGNICNLKLSNVDMRSNRSGAFGIAYEVIYSTITKYSISGNITGSGNGATGGAYYFTDSKAYECIINADITSTGGPAGGIASFANNSEIYNCYNTGTITSNVPAGGIASIANNSKIYNCYNTGIIIGGFNFGGVIGIINNYSSIENCYNIGKLEEKDSSTTSNCGGIAYSLEDGCSIKNTYYLSNTNIKGVQNKDDEVGKTEAKTLAEMQSQEFVNMLNDNKNIMSDSNKLSNWVYVKNGFPTLERLVQNELKPMKAGNNITIINKKQSKVIVHHYLQGTGPEYNNEPEVLAEDESIIGGVNDSYTTSPKVDIPNYTLTKDQNGEYIIPSNASGNFTEDEQHVYYYYNVEPVKLTVHHYLEGTENKLAEDEKYFYQQGEHYKVTPSEEVLKIYDFVSVDGTEEKDITEDEVVTYYYKLKQYKITTKVEIPESELEAGRSEKGGTISGEDEQPYETVKHGENSQKPLILTPNAGYKVSSITINGNQVSFTVNPDGTVELAKFENMTEDKEIIVSFVPTIGKVITHHYIQGTTEKLHDDIINEDKLGETVKTEPVNIDNYKLVGSAGNKDIDGNVLITKEISEGVEEIIYYYQVCYKITTDVIEHTENYKDGTVKQKVKGGTITNEDVVIHEQVVKYEDNVKQIEIKPDNEYEIEEILVNGRAYEFTSKLDANGNVILPAGTFTNVQENIHVQVKFRKKSKVIVKYLEEGKQTELAPETIIQGFDGKEFNTISELIPGYSLVKIPSSSDVGTDVIPKVTDENNNSTNPNGIMFSDDLTIIYWYTKPDANVIVRHIETNEKCEEIEIENELCKESVGANVSTNRKEYDKYISVDAPEETKEKIENNYENITIIEKDDNSKTVAVVDGKVIEVWYYYEKQYDITTEVKTHNETINGVETQVAGGTISKAYKLDEQGKEVEVTYEVVNSRGNSTKAIEMIPEDGYRIKTITVNDKEILINNISKDDLATLGIVKDGEKITLKEGYFKDVQNDFHVVVEFEKIPAKVIVKYLDAYTKESIIDDKVVEGYVYDKYNEQRVDIEGYIPAEPEPENSTGIMKIDPVTVVYYYTKQFKITTDVKEHLEDEVKSIVDVVVEKFEETITGSGTGNVTGGNGSSTGEAGDTTEGSGSSTGGTGNTTEGSGSPTGGTGNTVEGIEETTDSSKIPAGKILVKGGSITGEDETPYETVSRGETNTKQIEIIPNEGYRIKSLRIIDLGKEYNLSVESMINAKGTIILPSAYFTNMQSDKHIVVEFEPIPSKVIVNYLDIDTKEEETPTKVSKTENGNGYVNYDYKTHEKNVPFYELVKEELPKNAEGKLTKEDTIVNYWYKKLLFNMKLTKEFSSIKVNGEEVLKENNKFAKIDILNTKVADTNIIVKYKISVTNTEKVSGIATIIEQIPVGFKYVGTNENSENNTQQSNSIKTTEKWEEVNGKLQLTTKDLKPGETAEYEIELQWDKNMNCLGNLVNTAKITQTANIPNYGETTLEDNTDSCTIILAIKTGENRDVKTIISISCFILAGICTVIYVVTEVIARRKEKM